MENGAAGKDTPYVVLSSTDGTLLQFFIEQ